MTDLFGTSEIKTTSETDETRADTLTTASLDISDAISTGAWTVPSPSLASITVATMDSVEDHFKSMDKKLARCEGILDKIIESGLEETKKAREEFAAGAERAIATIEGFSPAGSLERKGKKLEELESCEDLGRAAVVRGAQEGAAWVIAEIRKRVCEERIIDTDGLKAALEACERSWELEGKAGEHGAPKSDKVAWTPWGKEIVMSEDHIEDLKKLVRIDGDYDGDHTYERIEDKEDLFRRYYAGMWGDTKKTE